MRYPTVTVNIEQIVKASDIALRHAYPEDPTLQLQLVKAVHLSRWLHPSNTKQYLISQSEVREPEI